MAMMMMQWELMCHKINDSDTVYWGTVSQDLVYIALSTYQTGKKCGGGEETDSQHNTFRGPTGFHTSQLVLLAINRVSKKHGFFIQLFCDEKSLFFYSQRYNIQWGTIQLLKFYSFRLVEYTCAGCAAAFRVFFQRVRSVQCRKWQTKQGDTASHTELLYSLDISDLPSFQTIEIIN